jgi:hypothetical protein
VASCADSKSIPAISSWFSLHTITVERGGPDIGQSSRQVGNSRARGLQRRRVLTHLGPLFRAVIRTGLRGPGTWS